MKNGSPRVAIVCDWLSGIGGAERVMLELHKLYPEAPIYTSQYNPKKIDWFSHADVRTGWLQKIPKALRKFLPPLRAWYFSHLDLSEYDLVISSSGAEAKGIRTTPKPKRFSHLRAVLGSGEQRKESYSQYVERAVEPLTTHSAKSITGAASSAGRQGNAVRKTVHICYMHSPTHYYWIRYDEYIKNPGFGRLDPLARLGLKLLVGPLKRWDYKAAQRPDYIIANSNHTQKMIKQFYGRDSAVIHPPVDVDRFVGASEEPRRGFVTAGRQTPYKRIDLVVAACTKLGLPLVVLGSGPDHQRLTKMAGKSITFLRAKNDEELAHYFKTSLAFIFPNMDDFGIVAVEALAAGTPVIAYKAGGALDYIEEGKTGMFFDEQTPESLEQVLQKFKPENFNNNLIGKYAQNFSTEKFVQAVKAFISGKTS